MLKHKKNNYPNNLITDGEIDGKSISSDLSNILPNEVNCDSEEHKEDCFFDSLPVYEKDLDHIVLGTLKQHYKDSTGEELNNTVLQKLKLTVKKQGKCFPTNALILLSDDDLRLKLFPYVKIECVSFKGINRDVFIAQKPMYGPLCSQADQAFMFVMRNVSKGSICEGVYQANRLEYPMEAINEVIWNAVIHRDYSLKGQDIKVVIFKNRIEISSPGNLLPNVDFSQLNVGQSNIRNESLAPILKKMGILKQQGKGLQIILEDLKKYPEIDFLWNETKMNFNVSFIKKNYMES